MVGVVSKGCRLFQPSTMTILVNVLLCSLWYTPTTTAFSPSLHRTHTNIIPWTHSCSSNRSSGCSSRRLAKSNSDGDDDDDDEIDLADRDWRDFRAQLVMSDAKGEDDQVSSDSDSDSDSESQSQSPSQPVDDVLFEDDLDGIGSIFPESQQRQRQPQQNQFETEAMSKSNFTPLEPSQWAYASGKVIEKGAVILGGVEQDYGFGLRQQYFHKSVILVLDHDEATFTKGIILNRPSDVILVDEEGDGGGKWRIWFGGDVQGLDSVLPEIVCLHSIKGDDEVDSVSGQVMKNIQWTTFDNAKALVAAKKATPSDFWVFAGYAGWGPDQLLGELDRKSWYMCATDSQTLLLELARQSAYTDPRDAGLDTWELLMTMIGREGTAEECSGDFEDLMLKEWARENLVSVDVGGGSMRAVDEGNRAKSLVTKMMERIAATATTPTIVDTVTQDDDDDGEDIEVGCVLRASSADRSPFLLQNQEYHKSLAIIISDNDYLTAGVLLNHPSSKSLDLELVDRADPSGERTTLRIPIRYGGPYAIRGDEGGGQPLFLHTSRKLRVARVGGPVGKEDAIIWRCTQEEVIAAIGDNLAKPDDFIIVSGISVWQKGGVEGTAISAENIGYGMKGEVESGRFEVVPSSQISSVWEKLQEQDVLTKINLIKTLKQGNDAWEAAEDTSRPNVARDDDGPVTDGIGEGFDEEDDSLVFKTDVPVAKLSDNALRSWVATFLLGAPSLGA